MADLSTLCPATGKRFSLGFQTDPHTLAKVWFSIVASECPHCGQKHAIKVREAYIEAVISDQQLRAIPDRPRERYEVV